MAKPAHNPSPSLSVLLSSTVQVHAVGEPIVLGFTVRNTGDESAVFCRYHTPFEGFCNNFLEVTGPDGGKIEYQGMMKKRLPPDADDFLQVPAFDALSLNPISVESDLQEGYSIKKRGRYLVRFIGNELINGLPDSEVLMIELK